MKYQELIEKVVDSAVQTRYTKIKRDLMSGMEYAIEEIVRVEGLPYRKLVTKIHTTAFPDSAAREDYQERDINNAFKKLDECVEFYHDSMMVRRSEPAPMQEPTTDEIVSKIWELLSFVPSSQLPVVVEKIKTSLEERLISELDLAAKAQEVRNHNLQSLRKAFSTNGETWNNKLVGH